MQPLRRHRLTTYGRIVSSVVSYIAFVVLDVTATITGAVGQDVWMIAIFACLGLAVLLLPRRPVPRGEARERADGETLDFYARIRTWLIWTRIAYLVVAVGLLLGLPRLV